MDPIAIVIVLVVALVAYGIRSGMRRMLACLLALACAAAIAQQDAPANGVLLVAQRSLGDANFGRSVVLATQAPNGQTVGVILNRPTSDSHEGERLWFGGPVLNRMVVALFRAEAPPPASAFHVLKNVYLSMHPQNVDALLAGERKGFRLYSGFSAWSPGQLQAELERDSWHVLPADAALVFRDDMGGLWEELVARAEAPRS
ncbi:MAG TPA: YqgE/AlgH family protein [Burkholderiales bacterium]|nr:YqgE/AlgH family protein [Burkholderiales bacterium]